MSNEYNQQSYYADSAFTNYSNYQQKEDTNFDLFSYQAPAFAPGADLFESELDLNLAGFEGLELLTVEPNDAFASFLRSDTYNSGHNGPLSSFSASSESAYDTRSSYSQSNYSESLYNSSYSTLSSEFENQFQNFAVESSQSPPENPASFGELPPTPPPHRSASSDYQPIKRRHEATTGSDYRVYAPYVSPNISLPPSPPVDAGLHCLSPEAGDDLEQHEVGDEKRRYRCKQCPRGFARAYNLKTHMLTHDPNRPKPHACTVRNCGRSFSRKHDLGRHMTSIHKNDTQKPVARVGVATSSRGWCDNCGRGFVGSAPDCLCEALDIK